MNAPFHIGQKVVALATFGAIKKDNVYTVYDVFQCHECKRWHVLINEVARTGVYHCTKKYGCNIPIKSSDRIGLAAIHFAPVQANYSDATAEILEKFSSPNESPDKIIQPQKATI